MKINLYHIMAALLSLVAANICVASATQPQAPTQQEPSYWDYAKNYGQKLGLLSAGGLGTRTAMRYIAPETSSYGTYLQQGLGSLKNAASSISTGAAGWVGGHARQLTNAAFGRGDIMPVVQAVAPKIGVSQLWKELIRKDPEKAIEVVKSIPGFSDTALGAAIIAAATAALLAGGAYLFGWNPIESAKTAFNKVSSTVSSTGLLDAFISPFSRFDSTSQLIAQTKDMIKDLPDYERVAKNAKCQADQNTWDVNLQAESLKLAKQAVEFLDNITRNIQTIETNKTIILDQIEKQTTTLNGYLKTLASELEPKEKRVEEINNALSSSSSSLSLEEQERLKLEAATLSTQITPLTDQITTHKEDIKKLESLKEATSQLDTLTAPKLDSSMTCPSSSSSSSLSSVPTITQ